MSWKRAFGFVPSMRSPHKQMASNFVRTINHAQARLNLGLINMAYNIKR